MNFAKITKSELLKISKPILFNTEMVRAILEGRKTVTRRVVNPKLRDGEYGFNVWHNEVTGNHVVEKYDEDEGSFYPTRYVNPPYRKGDILYVRETAKIHSMDSLERSVKLLFKADEKLQEFKVSDEFYEKLSGYSQSKWLSPYYLTKEVARIFLKVTDVRAERLQDITVEQVRKEGCVGVHCNHPNGGYACVDCMNTGYLEPPVVEFHGVWNSTIKKQDLNKYSWEANPWVWVYEFERVECDEQYSGF